MRMARARAPMARAGSFRVPMQVTTCSSFSMVSMGDFSKVRPRKSLILPMKMVTAMPAVKPVVMV